MDELSNFEQLINGNSTSLTEAEITGLISQMMLWFMVPLILISIVFLVLFILHSIRRRKLENAILEIRDILRDMNMAIQTPSPIPVNTPAPEAPDTPADPPHVETDSTKDQIS